MEFPSPPAEPGDFASLWAHLLYIKRAAAWLVTVAISLIHGQDAQEQHMQQQDAALTSAVADLKTNLDSLSTQVASEIQDLATAINAQTPQPSQAVNDAIVALQASNERIAALSQGLAADNPPVVAAPAA